LFDGCRHRSGFALARNELGTLNVFVPGVRAADNFDRVATLAVGPSAGDPDSLTGHPIADVASVHRHVARLSIHLHGSLALIVERHEDVVFLTAPQHAHVPAPAEKDRL